MEDTYYNLDYFANVPKRNDITHNNGNLYNPNSNHLLGLLAFTTLTEAHEKIRSVFPQYKTIEFVPGGGSLANERAILDQIKIKLHARPHDKNIVMISGIEHSSISKYVAYSLNERGYTVIIIPVAPNGEINLVK